MTDPDAPLDDEPGRHAAEEQVTMLERWRATEPVRVALYPIAVAVVVLLVGYGIVTPDRAPLWLNVAAAVAGGGLPILGAELARRGAWAPATVRRTVDAYVDEAYVRGWDDATEVEARQHDTPAEPDAAEPEPLPVTVESPEARPEPAYPPTAAIPRTPRGAPGTT